ncbi:hypothetical protein [Oceanobacillus senegalensis]|uniref:hypothetical protein n=1 Tax=Oceanobacillus senegalensis TaxID=1936063 RepID=UPI0015C45854|nr:hypothetical protein [Oceanobacillus senegalensis]
MNKALVLGASGGMDFSIVKTGSGKTTILNLLLRIYVNYEGSIKSIIKIFKIIH